MPTGALAVVKSTLICSSQIRYLRHDTREICSAAASSLVEKSRALLRRGVLQQDGPRRLPKGLTPQTLRLVCRWIIVGVAGFRLLRIAFIAPGPQRLLKARQLKRFNQVINTPRGSATGRSPPLAERADAANASPGVPVDNRASGALSASGGDRPVAEPRGVAGCRYPPGRSRISLASHRSRRHCAMAWLIT
jgi:hypothetical protein